MREIRMLRPTWRGLETWHGRDTVTLPNERARNGKYKLRPNRHASPRPYLGEPGGQSPPGHSAFASLLRVHSTSGYPPKLTMNERIRSRPAPRSIFIRPPYAR